MKLLKVSLVYSASDYSPTGNTRGSPLALPLRVLDPEGGLIAEGVASGMQAADFKVPPDFETVFVRLTWPSGKSQTQRVSLAGRDSAEIAFTDSTIARNEWSAWAVPRLNPRSSLARPESSPGVSIDRYDHVWLKLWQFINGSWVRAQVTPTAQYRNDAAKQLDFQLAACPWMLQVGGPMVPWRLVSLPGDGPCRVLLTPKDSTDPRADPLKIIVTGFRSDAETLLEFLSRDALRAATSLAGFQPLAVRLLADKTDDPLAAIAGAYFLLRTQGWSSIPPYWFDNLVNMFPWIPDAAVIRCIVTLRGGLRHEGDESKARALLKDCLQRGLPVYAEGLSLMQEAASVLRSTTRSGQSEDTFIMIERLAAANAWAGSAFSFYGKTPNEPSPEKFVGMPEKSSPLKRVPASESGSRRSNTSDRPRLPEAATRATNVGQTISLFQTDRLSHFVQPARSKLVVADSDVLFLRDVGK